MRFEFETRATPEQVCRAFTDFSEKRPQIWNRSLDARKYELRDAGPTWAIAREATAGSPFWVVCHYDWSTPGEVRWSVVDSSYGGAGDGVVRIAPAPGGGARVHAEWDATGGRASQRPLLWLLHRRPMAWFLRRLYRDTLDRYAESSD